MKYLSVKTSDGIDEITSSFGLDSAQANNFALTWTFLKEGMGLTDAQASGVMGNIYHESRFSSTNAQDSYGYSGIYNTNYSYSTTDGVGYGLMQWTYYSRKEDLSEIASDMGLSVGDINAQFAMMKYESENTYRTGWNNLKACTSHATATEVVLNQIEQCSTSSLATRKSNAQTIYNAMC